MAIRKTAAAGGALRGAVIGPQAQTRNLPSNSLERPEEGGEALGKSAELGTAQLRSFQESLGGPQLFTTTPPSSEDLAFSPQYLLGWLRSLFPGPPHL